MSVCSVYRHRAIRSIMAVVLTRQTNTSASAILNAPSASMCFYLRNWVTAIDLICPYLRYVFVLPIVNNRFNLYEKSSLPVTTTGSFVINSWNDVYHMRACVTGFNQNRNLF